jgi:hypothetical protein
MRIRCLGDAHALESLRRAAAGVGSNAGSVQVVDPGSAMYDAVCLLEPAPSLWGEVLADAATGRAVLLTGPPPGDVAGSLHAVCARAGTTLFASGLAVHSPWGTAAAGAGQGKALGAPVYLRFTAETGAPDAIFWHAAGAIELASETLGAPLSVYAAPVTDGSGATVHLALSVKHTGDCVSLLGIGALESDASAAHGAPIAGARRGRPGLLFLADRGALETNLAAGGAIYRDEPAGAPLATLRDDHQDTLISWLRAGLAATRTAKTRTAAARHTRWLGAVADAIQSSATSGRPEPIPNE